MKTIDLSYKLIDNMPVFTGDDKVVIDNVRTLEKDYYNAIYLKTGMHVGTHVDIPKHLLEDNRTIDEIGLDRFIGNGVLIDARYEQIIGYKKEYESFINTEDIVLVYTGFADLYQDTDRYYSNYPVIDDELADFFIRKNIKMIGFDTPSPDNVPFQIHKKLLGNDIFIIENLTNLSELLNINNFEVFVIPLKIKAEASLVRAFARIK